MSDNKVITYKTCPACLASPDRMISPITQRCHGCPCETKTYHPDATLDEGNIRRSNMTDEKILTINGIEIDQPPFALDPSTEFRAMPGRHCPEIFKGQEGCFEMDDGRKVWFTVDRVEDMKKGAGK